MRNPGPMMRACVPGLALGFAVASGVHVSFAQAPPPASAPPGPATTAPAATGAPSAAASTPSAPSPPKTLSETLTGMAKAEYEAGRILYGDKDYTSAIAKFQQAYQLSNEPRLLFNIAVCQKNLRKYSK